MTTILNSKYSNDTNTQLLMLPATQHQTLKHSTLSVIPQHQNSPTRLYNSQNQHAQQPRCAPTPSWLSQ